jgi:fructokinase
MRVKTVLFIGEMLIDFIPNQSLPAGLGGLHPYQAHPGGAVANAAIALARLGGSARFVGKLSEDVLGRLLLQTLQENGVDSSLVPLTRSRPTALAVVALRENGEREFTFYRQQTADSGLEIAEITDQVWEDAVYCHVGSVLLADEPARSATLSALVQARQRGLAVSFDINARPALWSSPDILCEVLHEVVSKVDLLKCSVEEIPYLDSALAEQFVQEDSRALGELGKRLLERGPRLVILTRGERGALLVNQQHIVEVPASTIPAIDTTGAGDAFMGAVLQKLLVRDWTTGEHLAALSAEALWEIGMFANRVAGLSCTRYGGIASLPYLAEIERL